MPSSGSGRAMWWSRPCSAATSGRRCDSPSPETSRKETRMTRFRLSIAGMMLLVAVVALGVMGLREGTEPWASAAFTLTVVILLGAILNAVHGQGSRRAFWGGFGL